MTLILRPGASDNEIGTLPLPALAPDRWKRRFRSQLILVLLDGALLMAGMELASLLWFGRSLGANGTAALALLATYLVMGTYGGAFGSDILLHRRRSIMLAARAVFLSAGIVVLAAFFLKASGHISRMVLVVGSAMGMLAIGFGRVGFFAWIRSAHGSSVLCEIMIRDDVDMPVPEGVSVIDAAAHQLRCDLSNPMMLDRVGRLVSHADRVIVACSATRRRNWAMILKGINVQGEVLSPELTDVGPLGTGRLGGNTTIIVAAGSLDLRQRLVKRAFDASVAGMAVLLLSPVLLLVALAIKIDSPGPILFVQDRVGRGNRLFGIYKFRSMRTETSDHFGNRSASRDDDRVTRVGRFIRATSIDELPQLFNILKGDMSLVGPRPHALGSLAGDLLFWEVDERYWHRHVCKPGLTGLAQVRGFRGATHKQSDLQNRLQADLEYVSGWTILRDLMILLATLKVIVHRNAY